MNRRQFIQRASAAALMVAAHDNVALSKSIAGFLKTDADAHPRILSLKLLTATPLKKMKKFYNEVLELPILEEKDNEITIGGGQTPITFIEAQPESGNPFYHVAFNVPENKLLSAYHWQKARTPLSFTRPDMRDPQYPNEVRHFRNWNAHSVFFWDPAGNLLEYIARHDLKNGVSGAFTSKDILYASEIAFIVDDVSALALDMQQSLSLDQYRNGSDRFRAIGDERGLLLIMKRGRNWGHRPEEAKAADVFPTVANIRGLSPKRYNFSNFPYEITLSS